ncbi:Predicted arabinose efflux permease, MFS family [Marinactinospora thermotolerans DSM 45154]|uniref:Predicted arabinose efflux permease, MFS family n=2 Tax=Marinactinospora thermotolerans TaxID=531310 RepID=A0A1T4LWL8_9ACTN|nr:Predicted arabinose efflux permease, MFS family [Marinactinospora thermotolerans DSM 45154]
MRPRDWGWLVCLMLVSFAIGTDDFVIAGVLPAISADLRVNEATAGQLVTAFSVTYAVAAPPLAVATATVPRRLLVIGGMSVFALVNLVSALAPNYPVLMALRVLSALVAAAITPATFAMAERLASPERAGRAIGVVAAGLTVSLFLGVPIGAFLGSTFGWRSTFVAVGLFSLAVAAAGALLLPAVAGSVTSGVRAQLRTLSRPAVLLCVAGTTAGACAGLMTYTYIAPITRDLTGGDGPILALLIAVVGLSGAAGTFLCGRATDRWGADRTLLATYAGLVAATVALTLIGVVGRGTAPVWLLAGALAVWGFAGWGFNPPMNMRMLRLAPDAGTEAVALNTSGLYVGIAFAGAIGGMVLAGGGGGVGVTVAAAGIGAATLVLMAVSVRRFPSPTPQGSSRPIEDTSAPPRPAG